MPGVLTYCDLKMNRRRLAAIPDGLLEAELAGLKFKAALLGPRCNQAHPPQPKANGLLSWRQEPVGRGSKGSSFYLE